MTQRKAHNALTVGLSLAVLTVFASATGCSCENTMGMDNDGPWIVGGYPCETSACGGTVNAGGTPNTGGDTSVGGEGGTAGDRGTN